MSATSPRVLLYAAGRTGVGQTQRAVLMARYVADFLGDPGTVLVVTGIPGGEQLFRSQGCRVVAPPEVVRLVSSVRERSAAADLGALTRRASSVLTSLTNNYSPDVFVTTSHRGVAGELLPVLSSMRRRRGRLVLALRDIYSPARFVSDFSRLTCGDFDTVLIGGPKAVREWVPAGLFDGPLAKDTRFVGYLRPPGPRPAPAQDYEGHYSILCQVGGGVDGRERVESVIVAARRARLMVSRALHVSVSTGPLMPTSDVKELLSLADDMTRIQRWWGCSRSPIAARTRRPDLVISMAGYNSCVETAWYGTPSVLLPRKDDGDLEQTIRAELFAEWFPDTQVVDSDHTEVLAEVIADAVERESAAAGELGCGAMSDMFAVPKQTAMNVLGDQLTLSGTG